MDPVSYVWGWAAAVLVGLSKTGLPGVSIPAVVLMTEAFPGDTGLAMGAMLPVLLFGDVLAVAWYRHHARWDRLWRLFPYVAAGMVPGALLLVSLSDGNALRPVLGGLMLALVALEVTRRYFDWQRMPRRWWFVGGIGLLAGFSTTVAHAAFPVMTVYLLSQGRGLVWGRRGRWGGCRTHSTASFSKGMIYLKNQRNSLSQATIIRAIASSTEECDAIGGCPGRSRAPRLCYLCRWRKADGNNISRGYCQQRLRQSGDASLANGSGRRNEICTPGGRECAGSQQQQPADSNCHQRYRGRRQDADNPRRTTWALPDSGRFGSNGSRAGRRRQATEAGADGVPLR